MLDRWVALMSEHSPFSMVPEKVETIGSISSTSQAWVVVHEQFLVLSQLVRPKARAMATNKRVFFMTNVLVVVSLKNEEKRFLLSDGVFFPPMRYNMWRGLSL